MGLNIPFGNFSATHSIGAGLEYSWSHHRFGLLSSTLFRVIGFTFNGGADYYKGKKENIGIYSYQYGNYIYLHSYAGIILNPGKKGNIIVTTGPAVGLYNNDAQFNFGVNLSGNYYFTKNFAVTPAIMLMKESASDPIWAASLRASIVL